MAAVVVSVIHIAKGPYNGRAELNGSQVERITAFLFHRGGHDDPQRLVAIADKSFICSYVLGMGFTFDDTDRNGVATPLTEMRRLIAKDPRNTERIFPYIGGEEVNTSPTHAHHRYVINFEEMTEAEARRWPDLMAILEERVKPERSKLTGNADAKRRRERWWLWWLWGRYTPALFRAIQIRTLERVLVNSQVSSHLAFAFLPGTCIYSHTLNVFPSSSYRLFCVLQSRVHEIWSRFFGSSLEDRMRYTPSDCFETFPFPENFQTDERLEVVGKDYYEVRGKLMVKNNEGLTKTYNRFHNLNDCSAEIKRLRERHAAMDLAVLDTYGWTDLKATCEFLPDYEEEDDEDDSATRRRKKPWRYRWPDNFRDEVLARLLELNKQRAEEERLAGIAADADAGKRANAKRAPRAGRKKTKPDRAVSPECE